MSISLLSADELDQVPLVPAKRKAEDESIEKEEEFSEPEQA